MEPHDPPPPYSETWTDAASVVPGPSPIIGTGSDDASLAASSTRSNIIYTPPETPTSEFQHGVASGVSSSSPVHTGTTTNHRQSHSNASAQAYFESRPAVVQAGSPAAKDNVPYGNTKVIIPIRVTQDTTPEDLAFPDILAAGRHDVSEQDWQTFVNYLIPDHIARSNASVISRKLQDQSGEHDSTTTTTTTTSPSPPRPGWDSELAQAQLDQIRSTFPDHALAERTRIARNAVWEWNDGFFAQRGVAVQLEVSQAPTATTGPTARASGTRSMPGAWDFEPADPYERSNTRDPRERTSSQSPHPSQASSAGQGQRACPGSSRWNPFSQALRLGPVKIDGDRVSIGNSFEADKSGGSLSVAAVWIAAYSTEAEEGVMVGAGANLTVAILTIIMIQCLGTSKASDHSDDGRSSISGSSVSSSSSSASAPSIGSLPDYEDLRDAQLPIVKQSISVWLAHPEQPVTREMVRAAKAEIKSARRAPPKSTRNVRGSASSSAVSLSRADDLRPPPPTYDEAQAADNTALREEVKALMAAFEGLKREQKQRRRSEKKQRRAARREKKKEKRAQKRAARAEKRAARADKRTGRHGARDQRRQQAQKQRDEAQQERERQLQERKRIRDEQLLREQQDRIREQQARQQQLEERRSRWAQCGPAGQHSPGAHHGGGGGGGWSPFGGFGRAGASSSSSPWGQSPPGPPQMAPTGIHYQHDHPHPPLHVHIPHHSVQPIVAPTPYGSLAHPHHYGPHGQGAGLPLGGGLAGNGSRGGFPGVHGQGGAGRQHENNIPGAGPQPQPQPQTSGLYQPVPYHHDDSDSSSDNRGIRMADNDHSNDGDLASGINSLSLGSTKNQAADHTEARIADDIQQLSLLEQPRSSEEQQHGSVPPGDSGRSERCIPADQVEWDALERAMAELLHDAHGLKTDAGKQGTR
ncbi:uncharacterized protein B0I36DRAFT_386364 [Microdochium trichocladiopsis]|uniref:Uncharacterized protein n=1 Tax=Microdochium trichocladiopsis TaxID=1682393 RepID=A0A9P8XYH3_9PEZI|nr:uncharacterized protein B0I36DRAFT_386364 [Microdochium trichocladiopsis]KAH7026010.1 hypothetical protein B0I36DRAFT_386364 [Microdochium trichocladiopsis]